ncbi:unnamed protein product [Ectocarpus sp. 12 AP-2014]
MALRVVRTRGMEAPYAKDQISAFVLHPIISVGFVVLTSLTLEPKAIAIALAPFLGLNIIVVGLWGYLSWSDPAGEGGCTLGRKRAETPHYCNYCRKTVRGFDHHCSWLNTCISARNYAHFYLLGVSGSLLYLYMTVAATLTVIWADEDDQREAFGSLTASRITWGIFIAVAGWIAVSFVALAGFHTYLLLLGLGTYDWVVMQNQKRQEKLTARRSAGAGGIDSRPGFCGIGCGCGRRPPAVPTASTVQDVAGFSTPGRPRSNGSWGGAGMGAGVT